MRGTRDQRWAAVYGAAWVYWAEAGRCDNPARARELAEQAADEAIAAEPEEMEKGTHLGGDLSAKSIDDGEYVWLESRLGRTGISITRSEAAALARLLARFAETGEL